jgi:hypothetical protein
MTQESTGAIILSPRDVAVGDPAGDALENINTEVLGDGAICYVRGGSGQGEWQLQKEAVTAANGVTIVEPIAGPGRWFLKSPPGVVQAGGHVVQSQRGVLASFTNGTFGTTFPVTVYQNIPGASGDVLENTLAGVGSANRLRCEFACPFFADTAFGTTTLTVEFEGSVDDFSSSAVLFTASVSVPAAGTVERFWEVYVASPALDPAGIPGWSDGSTVKMQVRVGPSSLTGSPELRGSNMASLKTEEVTVP